MALVTLPSQQDRAEQALAPEVGGRVSMCGGHREAGVPSLWSQGQWLYSSDMARARSGRRNPSLLSTLRRCCDL